LGATVQSNGTLYFLTASHCTGALTGANDGTHFWQPAFGATFIGSETSIEGQPHSGCPNIGGNPAQCLYADAVIAVYASGVSANLGEIAKPACCKQQHNASPITVTNPATDYLEISNVEGYSGTTGAFQGQEIDKIGQVTGWTYGYVIDPCQTYLASGSPGDPNEYEYVCQADVSGYSDSGDSGAPVFAPDNVGPALHGILVTGDFDGSEFQYSSMTSIFSELSISPAGWFFCYC
jgi:hypothetical protein